jgi:1-acyl-sn-glycerol-3-phosphate acyltransferase
MQSIPTDSKPRSDIIQPEITRLPELTVWRRSLRKILRIVLKFLVWLFIRPEVHGLENVPRQGPLIMVSNHLGDADALLGLAYTPRSVDILTKADLYYLPVLGKVFDAFGVIWVHRGQPDRRALRAALTGLQQGRAVGIAPEGRESLTGSLEEGTGGAAYLAYKSKAPILPVTMTRTENWRIIGNVKRLIRTPVTLTIGPVFYLEDYPERRLAIQEGTLKIMQALARQLPPEYQGVFQTGSAARSDSIPGTPYSEREPHDS